MEKSCLGIDIGSCHLKLALCAQGKARRVAAVEMPENLSREGKIISPQATAEFIRQTVRGHKFSVKRCAVLLPSAVAFARTMLMPAMLHQHLMLNLPYEFRDFITQEKDKYFYDYAVLDQELSESGTPRQLELMAAATLKETVREYSDLCRRAGLKLVTAIPEEPAYMNLIRNHWRQTGNPQPDWEYGFIDLGHTATRLHIYKGIKHQATRVIEYGVQLLDAALAEELEVDERIARQYKQADHSHQLESPLCQSFYASVSTEIMRAVNFYRFNSPDSNLRDIYLCGGGSKIAPLVARLEADLPAGVHKLEELLAGPAAQWPQASLCQTAIAVALQ